LMELAAIKNKCPHGALGVLNYWTAKRRLTNLLNAPSKLKKFITAFACALVVSGAVWISFNWSRSYFYPFGDSDTAIEWSELR